MTIIKEKMVSYFGMKDYVMRAIKEFWKNPIEIADKDGHMIIEREYYEVGDDPFTMHSYAVDLDEPAYEVTADEKRYRYAKDIVIAVFKMDRECQEFLERNPEFLRQYAEKWGGDEDYPQVELSGEIPSKLTTGDEFDWEQTDGLLRADGMISFDSHYNGVTYIDDEGIYPTDPEKLKILNNLNTFQKS